VTVLPKKNLDSGDTFQFMQNVVTESMANERIQEIEDQYLNRYMELEQQIENIKEEKEKIMEYYKQRLGSIQSEHEGEKGRIVNILQDYADDLRESMSEAYSLELSKNIDEINHDIQEKLKENTRNFKSISKQFSQFLKKIEDQEQAVKETKITLRLTEALFFLKQINENSNRPFSHQLEIIHQLAKDDTLLSALLPKISKETASRGIKTLNQLKEEFEQVEDKCRHLAIKLDLAKNETGFFSSFFSGEKKHPEGLVQGNDYISVLERAKYFLLNKGNLNNAIKELEQLPESLTDIFRHWINLANERRNFETVLVTLQSHTHEQTTALIDKWNALTPDTPETYNRTE